MSFQDLDTLALRIDERAQCPGSSARTSGVRPAGPDIIARAPTSVPPLTQPRILPASPSGYAAGPLPGSPRTADARPALPVLREGGASHPELSHTAKRFGSLGRRVLGSRTNIRSPSVETKKLFPASLAWGLESLAVGALLDSGADECLIDVSLARQAGIPLEPLDAILSAQALDGHSLSKVTHRTAPLSITLSGNHVESIQFYVFYSPMAPFVFGCPLLDMHDTHISWPSGQILGWSEACHANCLCSAPSPCSGTKPSLSPPVLTGDPPVYHDLAPVFSKESALSLPPHRPYDCAIDLLPGAPLPVG